MKVFVQLKFLPTQELIYQFSWFINSGQERIWEEKNKKKLDRVIQGVIWNNCIRYKK